MQAISWAWGPCHASNSDHIYWVSSTGTLSSTGRMLSQLYDDGFVSFRMALRFSSLLTSRIDEHDRSIFSAYTCCNSPGYVLWSTDVVLPGTCEALTSLVKLSSTLAISRRTVASSSSIFVSIFLKHIVIFYLMQ